MANYIDGFVFPISEARLKEYVAIANQVAEIYLQHGAVEYREFVADDLVREGVRAFPATMEAATNETIVFGWIIYESRESRDLVNQRVETDPRVEDLISPLVDPKDPIFSPGRMAYGGFRPLLARTHKENHPQPE